MCIFAVVFFLSFTFSTVCWGEDRMAKCIDLFYFYFFFFFFSFTRIEQVSSTYIFFSFSFSLYVFVLWRVTVLVAFFLSFFLFAATYSN